MILYVQLVCSFSHSYLHMDPGLVQFFFCITEQSEFFLVSPMKIKNVGFVVCSSPPPQWKTFVFTDIGCFLQLCLFCIVFYLASLFLLFGTKPLPQMLLPETVASCLQYRKAWPLALEKAMFVSSFWNLILEPFCWPGGLRHRCLLFSMNRTFV